MRDIIKKSNTLRTAIAEAVLKMKNESVEMVRTNTGPKPDIPATARAAAYLAVKNTASVIPHCHPTPVEFVKVDFEYEKELIKLKIEVKTIYKTGCEMEALHGVSVAALTVYDMLKPVDKDIEILNIRLQEKTGGKSDFKDTAPEGLKAAVVVCSDSVSSGKKQDTAGKAVFTSLESLGVRAIGYTVIPDDPAKILSTVEKLYADGIDLILTCGGTGLGPRDLTSETLKGWMDREIPGIMEAARSYGQNRTPYSMLSRGIAGMKGKTLLICLPGSTSGARETMDALFPAAFHIFKVIEKGYRHEEMEKRLGGGN